MFDHPEIRPETAAPAAQDPAASGARALREPLANLLAPYESYSRNPQQSERLFEGAKRDLQASMSRALKAGASVNARDGRDQSAINVSSAGGFPNTVRWLLAQGADPFPRVKPAHMDKASPLVSAVLNEASECLEILLAHPDNLRFGAPAGDKRPHLIAAVECAAHRSNSRALAALRRAAPIADYVEACENVLEGGLLPPNESLDALLCGLPDSPRAAPLWSMAFARIRMLERLKCDRACSANAGAPDEPQSPAEALPQTWARHERAILAEAVANASPVPAQAQSASPTRAPEAPAAPRPRGSVSAPRPSPAIRSGRRL